MLKTDITGFVHASGWALVAAGLLTFLLNAALTPLLPAGASSAETAATTVFLWRQSLSALAAMLLLYGAVGLYLAQERHFSFLGVLAFLGASVGSVLVVANEWQQVFLIRDLAANAPEALSALDATEGLGLDDLGSLIALAVFTFGWLGLAIATMVTGTFSRRGPMLVLAGFFAIPLLGALLGIWGAVAGNAALGAGWVLLGRELSAGGGAS